MLLHARAFATLAFVVCAFAPQTRLAAAQTDDPAAAAPDDRVVYEVKPSEADPAITQFDDPNVVVFNRGAGDHPELVVFMPGTKGKPARAKLLLSVVANLGYRAIGLEYNDTPAVIQICPRDPNPKCSGEFRQKRIFGDDVTNVVDNTPEEAIVTRLVKLLRYLDAQHPQEHWRDYLVGDAPDWSHIVVSGLSQGAGMAAYIAKQKPVARVVLFSSPWDFTGRSRDVAPWIFDAGATPPERWFAEVHRRENTADAIIRAYRALRIPEANISVFDLDVPPDRERGANPYHGSTIVLPGYIPNWQIMFGHAPPP
jgi:hypothetical protein